jgi:hypothetical protein
MIVAFESKHMCNVSKTEFMTVWVLVYLEAFDGSMVRTAFRVTGVVPFNPNFVTEDVQSSQAATQPCPCNHKHNAHATTDTF